MQNKPIILDNVVLTYNKNIKNWVKKKEYKKLKKKNDRYDKWIEKNRHK